MGGIVIEYTATSFAEPKPLAEIQYNQLKELLKENPYKAIFQQENTDGMYNSHYWIMAISACIVVVYIILNYFFGELVFMEWIALISGIAFFGGIYRFYLESSSYSNYEKDRDEYFLRMKFEIIRSLNFNEFNKYFYTIFSKHFDAEYAAWRKAYLKKRL